MVVRRLAMAQIGVRFPLPAPHLSQPLLVLIHRRPMGDDQHSYDPFFDPKNDAILSDVETSVTFEREAQWFAEYLRSGW